MNRSTPRWAVALTALTLLATACTSGTDELDSEGGQPSSARSSLEIAGVGGPSAAVDLVPHQRQELGSFLETLFTPLFQTNAANETYSNLLDSWTVSDDAQTVTLELKEDAVWSDETPVTSADVVMSLTQYLDPAISLWAGRIGGIVGQAAYAEGTADSIAGLTAPDDRTVVIQLEQPDVTWLPNLGYLAKFMPVLPSHILGDVPHDQLLAHEYFRTYPVTNGPYLLDELVRDQYVKLVANPNWSAGEAQIEEIFIKNVAADVLSAQLESGESQLITAVSPEEADRVGSIDGVEVQSATGAAPNSWWLMNYDPIKDPRVRQAMLYAIDRQGICEQVLQGFCTVPAANNRQLAPEWSLPTDDVIEYDYDPDRARDLLAEAGWDPGTELTFFTFDAGGIPDAAIEIAQANLAEVGITWSIIDSDVATTFEAIETGGGAEVQGFPLGGGNFVADPSQVAIYADCDAFYPNGSNLIHYCDPALDELWDAGRRETDQDRRAEIYQDAFRILNENPMEIIFYVQDQIVANDARLQGVGAHPSGDVYWNVADWTWEE